MIRDFSDLPQAFTSHDDIDHLSFSDSIPFCIDVYVVDSIA